MQSEGIIAKLKSHNLLGRGGAGFPTGLKWEMVKNAPAEKKFIICNGAEGDPSVFKDGFILKNFPEKVVQGVKIALEVIDKSSAYIYLRKDYYQEFKNPLKGLIGDLPVTLFEKTGGYLAGEESVVIAALEGKRQEPRIKPPFPPESGLFGYPTLINNVETFYYVAKIAENEYKGTRFYSLSGEIKNPGVYELPEDWSVQQILQQTGNFPDFEFFVQVGGGAAGEVLLPSELEQKVGGAGAVIVYNQQKTDLFSLMQQWADFFLQQNCDKCVPCREGVYRIAELVKNEEIDKELLTDLLFVLEETSFCALGKGVVLPFRSLTNKLL